MYEQSRDADFSRKEGEPMPGQLTSGGTLVVVSGPSGSGKTSIVEELIRHRETLRDKAASAVGGHTDQIVVKSGEVRRAVTATTRSPRPGEVDGQDYHFLTREAFEAGIADGAFIEFTEFNGNLYGTPRRKLEENLARGGVVLLVIDVDGAESIRFFFPNAIFVFVLPPTPEILRERLIGRGTNTEADVGGRLAIARREISRITEYDFLIVNADLRLAVLDLAAVIRVVRRSRVTTDAQANWEAGLFADWPG